MISDELSKTSHFTPGAEMNRGRTDPHPSRHVAEDRTPGTTLVIAMLQ